MKRAFDLVLIFFSLPLVLPLAVLVAIAVYVVIGKPIFFKQNRSGKDARTFEMLKFRTMANLYDDNNQLLSDSCRFTKFGELLRKTSLDELPELWNVIRGDMSLVGPRPLLPEYLDLYSNEQFRRHEVKPGITGWAQVNGRNSISWEEKFKLDIWYVDNQSLFLDLKIIFLTLLKVIRMEGVLVDDRTSISKFKGNER